MNKYFKNSVDIAECEDDDFRVCVSVRFFFEPVVRSEIHVILKNRRKGTRWEEKYELYELAEAMKRYEEQVKFFFGEDAADGT